MPKKTKRCFSKCAKKVVEKKEEAKNTETVSIDSLVVLKDIDLNIKRGEFVCIIGDVGSGKSSLLNSIIGDLIPINQAQIQRVIDPEKGMEQHISKDDAKKFYDGLLKDIKESDQPIIELQGDIAYVQ